ncbi:MAG TPA: glycosyltransferase family 4 protein [Saprospiraceae bacterium]|nr:glycosyltransferase family 4 protein [Saprospiraceae bacterium]
MKVLHLFDLYLPHTMNWAYRMIRAMPDAEHWAAAPWIVRNEYFSRDIRFFIRPLQRMTGWLPESEWRGEWFAARLVRSEHYCPANRNWLLRRLKNARPDVLHAHFAPVGFHYLDLAKKLDIPLVVSFYGYDYESLPFRKHVWQERYRRLFHEAKVVTCAGEHGREVLIGQGCPAQKINVLPMSMQPGEFPFCEREKQPGKLRLVQVATITEKKGYMDTLDAFNIALKRCPGMHLTIAGERYNPQLVSRMQQFIKTNDLEQHVTWLDFMPHGALPQLFSTADVFIHPSHYTETRDCEGGPVSILEAQATGLPVISTNHFDIPSEVLHSVTGLLAPERDPAMLAQHIERFYSMQHDEYQQFSHHARRHVEQNFDVKNTAQKLHTIYAEIVHNSSFIVHRS